VFFLSTKTSKFVLTSLLLTAVVCNFHRLFYTLGLFVAMGNTKLSNIVWYHTTNQKVFGTKTFYSSGGSFVAVERQYCREFLFVIRHLPMLCDGLLNTLAYHCQPTASRELQYGVYY
jgi:hypothetical protein